MTDEPKLHPDVERALEVLRAADTLDNSPDDPRTLEQKHSHKLINLTASLTVLAHNSAAMATSVKAVSEQIGDVEEKRRRDRIIFGFCIVLLVVVIGFGGAVVSGNREQLHILRDATSPEAQARQAEATERIVQRIDCNSQESLRRVLEGFSRNNPNMTVPPREPQCEALLGKTSTTTTP